ncbi:MAG: hypothetical protein ACREFS_12450, partial [Acetobacteraceae bacterium]
RRQVDAPVSALGWSYRRFLNALRRTVRIANVIGGGTPFKSNATFRGGDVPWLSPKDMKPPMITETADKTALAGGNRTSIAGSPIPWRGVREASSISMTDGETDNGGWDVRL